MTAGHKEDWGIENHDTPVPVGEWFLLEVFMKQSTGGDGRLWVAVNGDVIADHRGRTNLNSTIRTWNIFKAYTAKKCISRGEIYQWIDDVEIYDDFPEVGK